MIVPEAPERSECPQALVNAGLKSPRRRRPPKHRVRRQRMPREGMLIQLDGSHHHWLGDQVPPFTLLIAVDDATGTVVDALFCEKKAVYSYFLLIQGLLQRVGIPVALYTDRHGVFRHTPGAGLPATATQFSRAMDEVGIQMIFALSPQAKGRVERAAGTFGMGRVHRLRAFQFDGSECMTCPLRPQCISQKGTVGADPSSRSPVAAGPGLATERRV